MIYQVGNIVYSNSVLWVGLMVKKFGPSVFIYSVVRIRSNVPDSLEFGHVYRSDSVIFFQSNELASKKLLTNWATFQTFGDHFSASAICHFGPLSELFLKISPKTGLKPI